MHSSTGRVVSVVSVCACIAGTCHARPDSATRERYISSLDSVRQIDTQKQKMYINQATQERIIYTDRVAPRAGTEDKWVNLEGDPCGDGGFYLQFVNPAGNANFPEVERAPAVGMQGDVAFDTLVDQLEFSFTTVYTESDDPDPSTPGVIEGNNIVLAIMEGDDGFGDTVAQPLVAIGLEDLPTRGTNAVGVYTVVVDLGTPFEMGDTDDNPVTNDINGEIADPTAVIYNALGGDAGDPSVLDRDPVFFGPGNGPGDGALDFSVRFWFEQPGVTLGDESTYGNIVPQGMALAGPPELDDGSGSGYNDCSQLIGSYTLPGPLALYDNTDYYGFDGGLSGTGGADPLAPFGANFDVSLWFGGSCCFPGVDPNDPVLARRPMATFYFALRGPASDDVGIDCPVNLVQDEFLNIDDVLAFLSAFAASDQAADFVDDDIFNIDDVLAFLGDFALGCDL